MINLFLPGRPSANGNGISRRTEDPGIFTTAGIYSPLSDFWYTAVGKPTSSRVRVTDDVALTYSAVWACTRILAGTLAGLPLHLCERESDGAENVLRDDNRNHLMEFAPNEEMNAMMGRSQGAIQQINGGNCFFQIEFYNDDPADGIAAYWPIHRSRVRVKRGAVLRDSDTDLIYDIDQEKHGNELYYEIKNNDKTVTIFDPREILHFPSWMTDDGISGKGVITYARETVGFGLATERYGATWFGTGGVPRVAVTIKGKMNDDAKRNFRKEWKEIYGGSDGDRVGLLTEGNTLTPISINNNDSQFLETRGYNVEETSRWYGVPPHMVAKTIQNGITSIEQIGMEFLTYTMAPWFRTWTQELHKKTLTPSEQRTHFYRFDFDELLRMDAKTRSEYLRTVIQIGIRTPNEGRRMEGLNPYKEPEADKLYMQGAMMPLDKVGTMVNQPNPDTKESQQGKDAQGNPGIGGALALVQHTQQSEQRIVGAVSEVVNNLRIEFSQKLLTIEQREPPKTAEPADVRTPALLAAAKVMLIDAADRVIRKECWAARNAAKTPSTFLAWLDKFYGDEYPKLYEKLFSPACSMLMILGVPANAAQLANVGAAESRDALLSASDGDAAKFGERIESLVGQWEKSGANELADNVMGGQAA